MVAGVDLMVGVGVVIPPPTTKDHTLKASPYPPGHQQHYGMQERKGEIHYMVQLVRHVKLQSDQ